jgi:soluble lytic murein transglycosylase-like protein
MKITKLPNLKMKNSKSIITLILSWFALLLTTVCIFAFLPDPSSTEKTVSVPKEAQTVINTTTNIISRDGKIDKNIARQYALWIFESSYKYGVDPLLILSVMSIESKFKSDAISGANAIGLMQVIHRWHKEKTTQANLFLPQNNIEVGTKILSEYSKRSDSDTETLLRYNGALGKNSTYAQKVLAEKRKYTNELMIALK